MQRDEASNRSPGRFRPSNSLIGRTRLPAEIRLAEAGGTALVPRPDPKQPKQPKPELTLSDHLQHYFDVDAEFRNETAELYKPYYTQDGHTTKEIAQDAINSLSNTMNISKRVLWNQIYDFSFIEK